MPCCSLTSHTISSCHHSMICHSAACDHSSWLLSTEVTRCMSSLFFLCNICSVGGSPLTLLLPWFLDILHLWYPRQFSHLWHIKPKSLNKTFILNPNTYIFSVRRPLTYCQNAAQHLSSCNFSPKLNFSLKYIFIFNPLKTHSENVRHGVNKGVWCELMGCACSIHGRWWLLNTASTCCQWLEWKRTPIPAVELLRCRCQRDCCI